MTSTPVLTTTARQIVASALRKIGEIDATQQIPSEDMNDGLEALNYMVKGWQAQGLHLWTKTEGILFLDAGKTDYKLGPSGDKCGNLDDFSSTELSVAAAALDRTIAVDSTAGIDGADNILSSDPSESTQGWTAVNGAIAVVGTSLEVSNATPDAGEAERIITGLVVGRTYRVIVDFTLSTSPSVTYSIKDGSTTLGSISLSATGTGKFEFTATQLSHTLEILNGDTAGTNATLTDRIEILDETTGDYVGIKLDDNTRQWTRAVEILSATDIYVADAITGAAAIDNSVFSFPELIPRPLRVLQCRRFTVGLNDEIEATQWSRQEYFAQPDKTTQGTINNWYFSPQLTDSRLYIWQTARDVDQVVKFTYTRPIDITGDTADNPDFPAEWFRPLVFALAAEIGPEYRIPQDRLNILTVRAEAMLQDVLGFDRENDALDVQPWLD